MTEELIKALPDEDIKTAVRIALTQIGKKDLAPKQDLLEQASTYNYGLSRQFNISHAITIATHDTNSPMNVAVNLTVTVWAQPPHYETSIEENSD